MDNNLNIKAEYGNDRGDSRQVDSNSASDRPRVESVLRASEDRILSKIANEQNQRSSEIRNTVGKSAPADYLDDLEARIARKSSAFSSSDKPSHQNKNDSAQYQLSASMNSEPDAALARLEERIAAKVASSGIPSRTRGSTNDEISKIEEQVASKIAADSAMNQPRADSRSNALTKLPAHEENRKASLQVHEENIKDSKESPMKANTASSGFDNEHTNTNMSLAPTKYVTTHGSHSDRVGSTPLQECAPDVSRHTRLGDTKVIDMDTLQALQGKDYVDPNYCLDDEDNLAVAVPVAEDEDEDKFLPAAIEFDPDQKNAAVSKSRKKTYICLGIVALVVIVSVVVGVVVGTNTTSDESSIPAVNPREQVGISNFVASQVGTSALEIPDSPYKKALDWMTFNDPLQLTIDAPNFMQRYLLAYTYYATSATHPWVYCSPPIDNITEPGPCRTGRISRLRENFPDWTSSKKYWLSGEDECEWAGIDCDKMGNVVSLQIAGRNMTGSLSNIERLLPFVNTFDVSRNGLQGSIPAASFQNSKYLHKLALLQNSLTGPIPTDIWSLRNLQSLAVYGNMFTGSLPEQLSIIKDMKSLELSRNRFNGTISSTILNLKSTFDIFLDNNLFSGILPSELFMLPKLVVLYLQNNKFSENLPRTIELPKLVKLDVGSNMLTGQIPDAIYNSTLLIFLQFTGNFLNGTISTLIGKLTDLSEVTFDTNQFTGTIPLEIGNITTLQVVTFSGTNLTGSVPDTMCSSKKWKTLSADCAADDDREPEISCTCCTSCCNAAGQSCL